MLAKSWIRSPAVFVVAAAVLFSGCSILHRGKKTEDVAYQEAPVEQLYSAGADRLDRHLWSDAVNYFKEVERQHPYSEWSRRSICCDERR